jgi:L-2-hydroxyglutarate oxidase
MGAVSVRAVVVGGGIVGLAAARALAATGRVRPLVLEAEERPASHQTGHNSGVIHSGLYYRPGSRKAEDCAAGREELYEFCRSHGVPHERCGKLVLATRPDELPRLAELERRGRANGLAGLRRLEASQIAEFEPHARGVAALWVPQTGIVDYTAVAAALARGLAEQGVEVRTGARVRGIERASSGFRLACSGNTVEADFLIGCAGLQSDRLARMCGLDPAVRIVPFRGEYHRLAPARESLVRNLIYPVPDPALPFLGVHLTRRIGGGIEAGPNAVLAASRDGYRFSTFSLRDTLAVLSWPGFWRMARRHWRTGVYEVRRSIGRRLLARDLRSLVPAIGAADLERWGAGVRAQAVGRDGALLDDFVFAEGPRMLHVVNAPSPAATASLAIGRRIAERVLGSLDGH